jgi:hypothetical protein
MNNWLEHMNQLEAKHLRKLLFYVLCVFSAAAIFLVDLAVPLGVAMGVAYLITVLLSLWLPSLKSTLWIAASCSILIILGYYYSPPGGELWKVLFNRSLSLLSIWVTAIAIVQKKRSERKRDEAIAEREKALREIKILQGILPICSSCKKIRDDKGSWKRIEMYIMEHSEADFSHGICPECVKKLYPEFQQK